MAGLLAGCGAHQAQSLARDQLSRAEYEAALATLDKAQRDQPQHTELRSAWLRARAEAVARLVAQAGEARARGQFDQASLTLQRAARLDPDNPRLRELAEGLDYERRARAAQAEAEAELAKGAWDAALKAARQGLQLQPRHAALLALQRRIQTLQREQASGATALAETRPIALDFRDTPLRTVLDAVSRHSGLSFVFDKDIRPDLRITVFLKGVRVEEALDLITSTHQLVKKVLDPRTVLIYPNTAEKQREHQEQVVKAFHLISGDVKQAAQLLRTMLRVREPFVDERSNLLVVRESAEVVRLAERLIALYDSAEPEVTLDLEVLEVSATRLTEIGIKFPDTIGLTPLSAAGATGLTVSSLRDLDSARIGVSVAGLLLNLRREVGDFETLANPRVRIRNREKARVLVGNRLPVVTTTTTATGLVSDSVNYIDVGLKLDLEPTVYADDDVAIRVGLEVSSVGTSVRTSSGTLAYQIVTRNANTVLRLRDGETQVLAGLVSREERSSASRLPGLGDLPLVGRLFSSQRDDGSRSELVLAITPRVVRNISLADLGDNEIWVGTEALPRLRAPGLRPVVLDTAGGDEAVLAEPGASDAGSAAGAVARTARTPSAAVPAPWTLRWQAPSSVAVGEEFSAELVAEGKSPLRGANLILRIKPEEATVIKGDAGPWWSQEDGQPQASQAVDTGGGQWQLGVIRRSASGVSGQGVVAVLRLKALKAGRLEWPLLQMQPIAGGPDPAVFKDLPALNVEVRR